MINAVKSGIAGTTGGGDYLIVRIWTRLTDWNWPVTPHVVGV